MAVGVAFLAVLGAIWVSVEVLGTMESELHPNDVSSCEHSVEVVEDGLARLGCSTDRALAGCEGLTAGSRVELNSASCVVTQGAMRAAYRLRSGIPLDLNRVSASDLMLIQGIGPKLSEAIVAQRQARGGFKSVEELLEVNGIGEAKLEMLKPVLLTTLLDADAKKDETMKEREAQ